MTGNEFIRKIRRLGRKRGVTVAFVPERGKGSHGTLYYGEKLTIVRNPQDELKTGHPPCHVDATRFNAQRAVGYDHGPVCLSRHTDA
jgi:mRNA interferase HicA